MRNRIAALEAKAKNDPTPAAQGQPAEKSNVPIVYPLHYKRFMRRTTSATPVRPETPIYKSKQPVDEPVIHSPKPTRSMPSLPAPAETPTPTQLSKSDPYTSSIHIITDSSRSGNCKRKKYVKDKPEDAGVDRITPASFLHGTKSNCVRHGRKRPLPSTVKQPAGARDMMAKSRSGAYIPTGLTKRRQMEATSPWVVPSNSLTKTDATKPDDGSDACPDCVAELSIKRRELNYGSIETIKRPTDHIAQITTKPAVDGSISSMKRADLPSTEDSNMYESEDDGLVGSRDLGEGLDAIIVENKGELRRVVVNARKGQPTIETMQRLSQELAKVSNSIAFASVHQPSAGTANKHQTNQCAVLVDSGSTVQNTRLSSVPELLDMIDQAANEIHLNTGKLTEHYVRRRDVTGADRHSLLSSTEFDDVMNGSPSPTQGLVSRQSMDEQYRNLHEHLMNAARKNLIKSANVEPPGGRQPQQDTSKANGQQLAQLSSKPATMDKQGNGVPSIIRTRPTLQRVEPKANDISPVQTPPPEQPSIHHATELADLPAASAPSSPTPKVQEAIKHHNPFHSWLNPFYHHNLKPVPAESPKQSQPASPLSPTPTPPSSFFAGFPTRTNPELPTPTPSVPDITSHPNPYHHSPAAPPRLNYGEWASQKAREHQQVIKDAIRMKNNNAVQEASAVERELRRQRSALGGERKDSVPRQ